MIECLVYLLTCRKCKLQYVGQTTEAFRLRWNNYRCNFRKFLKDQPCMQKHIFEHFLSQGHSGMLEDISITFIDENRPKKTLRKRTILDQNFKHNGS